MHVSTAFGICLICFACGWGAGTLIKPAQAGPHPVAAGLTPAGSTRSDAPATSIRNQRERVRPRITSRYGWRRHPFTGRRQFHDGVDIGLPRRHPIGIPFPGMVIRTGYNPASGKYVVVRHDGFTTHYAHLQEVLVRRGALVRRGGLIGTVGSTGLSTAPHLHLAVKVSGKSVDPIAFLSRRNRATAGSGEVALRTSTRESVAN